MPVFWVLAAIAPQGSAPECTWRLDSLPPSRNTAASAGTKRPGMKRITVVGTGFGGLTAVSTLRKLEPSAEITVIGKQPEFFYYPSLIWIPSGMRNGDDITVNLENFFRRKQVVFHQGAASGIRDGGRVVETDNGEVGNDGLIIATGGRYLTSLPGIEHAAIPCRGREDAERIRDRLNELDGGTIAFGFGGNPKEPTAMRGGPVFEFLFGTDTLLRRQRRRDRFKLVFFAPSKRPGQRLGDKAVDALLKRMAERNISTHLGHKLKGFEAGKILTEGGDVAADLIVFIPGMSGSPWLDNTTLPKSAGGLLQADAHCRVPGWERVYVTGDTGSFPGPDWQPKQAHMADLQAVAAAKNLVHELNGNEPVEGFKVELACIIDSLDSGTLVTRTSTRSRLLPATRLLHWSKRLFEWWYLRQYR
jgi:sulfide:quinone oxidoreductase